VRGTPGLESSSAKDELFPFVSMVGCLHASGVISIVAGPTMTKGEGIQDGMNVEKCRRCCGGISEALSIW